MAVSMRGNPSILEQRVRRVLDSSIVKEREMIKRSWVVAVGIGVYMLMGCTSPPVNIDSDTQTIDGGISAELVSIGDATGISIGEPDAPVTLIEFADFNCSHCRNLAPIMTQVIDEYVDSGDLRVVFVPTTIVHTDNSVSQAAYCAAEAGKGWEMIDSLWEVNPGSDGYTEAQVIEVAESLGLDPDEFAACMDSETTTGYVEAALTEIKSRGQLGVPTLYVNDERIPLQNRPYNYDDLAVVIEAALERD